MTTLKDAEFTNKSAGAGIMLIKILQRYSFHSKVWQMKEWAYVDLSAIMKLHHII